MRYPEFLKSGGTVGFIAPSFGCSTEPYKTCFESALEMFRSEGFGCVCGPNCCADDGLGKSSTPENCAGEINDFFINNRSDVIISCGGGETMCEDLPFADFEAIASAYPKWYMGYSDNTNLTFTLPTLCDTAAVYGPCAAAFGMKPLHESLEDALALLKGEKLVFRNYSGWESVSLKGPDNPLAPYNITEPYNLRIHSPAGNDHAEFSGRLLGGCIDCLSVLCGTKFDAVKSFNAKYGEEGIIWFLEACDLSSMGVLRALWQMENAGWFEKASGFIIGRPMHIGESFMGLDMDTAVLRVLAEHRVPILLDADIGHLPPMMPMISGARARVTAARNSMQISYKLT